MRLVKRILRIGLVGIVALLLYKLLLLDQMGFCSERAWFVSSEELILNHIDRLMESGRIKLDAEDSSAKAYLARHPSCCRVERRSNPFLFSSAEVTVVYEMSDREKALRHSNKEHYYELIAFDSACGRTLESMGTTTTAPIASK